MSCAYWAGVTLRSCLSIFQDIHRPKGGSGDARAIDFGIETRLFADRDALILANVLEINWRLTIVSSTSLPY